MRYQQLQQVLVAVSGSIELTLKDASGKDYFFKLDNPTKGLFVPQGFWRDLKFSHNAVLVCMASAIFDEEDYIRDFKTF